MVVTCPNCAKQLKLGSKILQRLKDLGPGKKIKVKCTSCSTPMSLDSSSVVENSPKNVGHRQSEEEKPALQPPSPPGIDWLKDGSFEDNEVVEDVPRALVLFPDIPEKAIIVQSAEEFGYLVEQVDQPDEAIDKIRFVSYAAVFLHNRYERGGVNQGGFHHFMREMEMGRRRYMFYVLIGDQFDTLYDLQALAYSANLVVNEADTEYIATLLRKTIPEYERLFGPLMEELRIAGK